MTGTEILNNTFFGFWHILGEHFILLISFAWTFAIVLIIIYILTKK